MRNIRLLHWIWEKKRLEIVIVNIDINEWNGIFCWLLRASRGLLSFYYYHCNSTEFNVKNEMVNINRLIGISITYATNNKSNQTHKAHIQYKSKSKWFLKLAILYTILDESLCNSNKPSDSQKERYFWNVFSYLRWNMQ